MAKTPKTPKRTCKFCNVSFDPLAPPACSIQEGACQPKPRGFAAMSKERVREIAAIGGAKAHQSGSAHKFSTEEARAAGRKGGFAPHVRRGKTPRAHSS